MSKRPAELIDAVEIARRLCLRNRHTGEIDPGPIDDLLYRDPTFPRPRKLGRLNRWPSEEIDAWIAALPAKKGGEQ